MSKVLMHLVSRLYIHLRPLRLPLVGLLLATAGCSAQPSSPPARERVRVLVTTDGEIDDACSLVRFLLYTNEWDVEGIITSSSQYHWHGHNWAGDDWLDPYLAAYAEVYPNLTKHDPGYPTPQHLRSVALLGNVAEAGEMDSITAGSQHIVEVLLDDADQRPIWVQAWGGTNTIARALRTIEEEHPVRMEEVAKKLRFFFIWEQDSTYQAYIRPNWGKYNIPTIVCDQFWAIAYQWNKILPADKRRYFEADWMKENILAGHGRCARCTPPMNPVVMGCRAMPISLPGISGRRATRRLFCTPLMSACAVWSRPITAVGAAGTCARERTLGLTRIRIAPPPTRRAGITQAMRGAGCTCGRPTPNGRT